MAKKVKKTKTTSYQRLTPYLRGAIFAFAIAGFTLMEIQEEVRKPDGTAPCLQSISDTVARSTSQGGFDWDGESSSTSRGRPRVTTTSLDKKIVKFVFQHRGRARVTASFVKKKLKETRKLSTRTLQKRLEQAGLAYLRRRRKSIVPAEHKLTRISFAKWVLKQTSASLKRWAFTDGASFYLARSVAEHQQGVRAALGPFVWRMADGSDALYEDCLGPSSYRKSQGTCVRIWGLLLLGTFFVYVLPEDHERGRSMNRWWCEWIVLNQFPKWIAKAMGHRQKPTYLVQDHEKALWTQESRDALRKIGVQVLERYPKCSQDLNAIETAWRELRARLAETEPAERESRDAFVARLRNAVAWANQNRKHLFMDLCSDQKTRAHEVLERSGGRTSF